MNNPWITTTLCSPAQGKKPETSSAMPAGPSAKPTANDSSAPSSPATTPADRPAEPGSAPIPPAGYRIISAPERDATTRAKFAESGGMYYNSPFGRWYPVMTGPDMGTRLSLVDTYATPIEAVDAPVEPARFCAPAIEPTPALPPGCTIPDGFRQLAVGDRVSEGAIWWMSSTSGWIWSAHPVSVMPDQCIAAPTSPAVLGRYKPRVVHKTIELLPAPLLEVGTRVWVRSGQTIRSRAADAGRPFSQATGTVEEVDEFEPLPLLVRFDDADIDSSPGRTCFWFGRDQIEPYYGTVAIKAKFLDRPAKQPAPLLKVGDRVRVKSPIPGPGWTARPVAAGEYAEVWEVGDREPAIHIKDDATALYAWTESSNVELAPAEVPGRPADKPIEAGDIVEVLVDQPDTYLTRGVSRGERLRVRGVDVSEPAIQVEEIVEGACSLGWIHTKDARRAPVRVYVAARYPDVEYARGVARGLAVRGFEVVSTWHVPGATQAPGQVPIRCFADIRGCDLLVLLPSQGGPNAGGKFVETGYALGLGKSVVVVGNHENWITNQPGVRLVNNVAEV